MSKPSADGGPDRSPKTALPKKREVFRPARPALKTDRKISDPAIAKLKARVRRLTGRLAKAADRIRELEDRADTDVLFNVMNRRGFERELDRMLAHIKRYRATAALIALDVDRLKPINDTFGHAAGDAVLKGIVGVILKYVRSSDFVGRLGGDEFAILLWNLGETDAQAKAAALEEAIDRLTFTFRGQSILSGASTGVTMLTSTDDATAVLERADFAMYARKRQRCDRTP